MQCRRKIDEVHSGAIRTTEKIYLQFMTLLYEVHKRSKCSVEHANMQYKSHLHAGHERMHVVHI